MTAPNRFGGEPPKKKSKIGADAETKQKAFNDAQDSSVLPAYPVALLVAKDVNISITNNAAEGGATGKDISKAISEGGEFLCFSTSSSSDSHTTSHCYATHSSKFTSIRLLGPQVLGWFMQAIRDDETNTDYTPFDATTLPKHKEGKKEKK
ncbi:hypothetical protein DFH08DRAFT_951039 [Mycena albidolilacea]|uniref:Uncharacterized protein n=1 Tax=Mycena albidolilacea TaxID=1033008 RepID=A0AAD7F3E6_9AGAR|nr:hypothetical protein DFH08DRAFT_951039 [Mycena albidolilacea]